MSEKPERGSQGESRSGINGGLKPPKKRQSGRIEGLFDGLTALPSAPGLRERAEVQQKPPDEGPAAPAGASSEEKRPKEITQPARPPVNPPLSLPMPAGGAAAQRDADLVIPSEEVPLSPLAWESLQTGRPMVRTSENSRPATLAYGRRLSGALASDAAPDNTSRAADPALLLEVLDDDPDRVWSEDELLLVEQVTDQLTLALENARLFEEARQRNEELATLNRVTSAVSTTLALNQVLPEVLQQALAAIGYNAGLISIIESSAADLPVAAVHHNLKTFIQRGADDAALEGTVSELVYRLGETLYLPDLSQPDPKMTQKFSNAGSVEAAARRSYEMGYHSYIGVPLLSKGLRLGTICLFAEERTDVPPPRVGLLEAVGRQVGVAIENVRLFEETQRTADALQISERYQKGVAQAVAALTERGVAALSEALALLGEAAQVDRVHYLETQVDQDGPYWRLINEWRTSGRPSQFGSRSLRRIGLRSAAAWLEAFRAGSIAILPDTLAPVEYRLQAQESELLTALGARSALIFAVPGRHETPGCVVFEQAEQERSWSSDEIAALQTAASALANTLAREDLFTQVQANLAETEAQYQASSRLNNAASYTEILTVLRQHTILGHINTGAVMLCLFDQPWTRTERPNWLMPIARWSAAPPATPQAERYPLSTWESAELLLDAERPTMVLDAAADPRLDDEARQTFSEETAARSLLFVPMNVSGRWIGHIIGAYRQITGFPDQEVRRLASLAGQAAVAVENLRLLDETRRLLDVSQRRARQLQTAAEIARDAAASSLALDALLGRSVNLVCERFGYSNAAIYLLDEDGVEAVAAGVANYGTAKPDPWQSVRLGDDSTAGLVMETGRPLVLNNLDGEDGARAELGIPLKLGERVIGALDVHADRNDAFSQDDVTVLQTLADQIAVAVDNAQAYALTQKAVEEIREADRLKSQFLANMSHELRTPLNSIIGFSRVILKGIDGPINDQQSQDLAAIYSSGQHLLGLINDVLDLSRIEAGKMDLSFEEDVNLGEIIHSVMSTTIGLVKDKPIELHEHVAADLPTLSIDPMKIRQVLINLLSNAAKFTDEGTITVEAATCTEEGRPAVIVRVTDSGPGIAEADQAKLFQPFSQVDGSLTRKTGGSGLGLSICHHLIRMHGGRIGLESETGKGSTFYFILPVEREQVAPVEEEEDLPGGMAALGVGDGGAAEGEMDDKQLQPDQQEQGKDGEPAQAGLDEPIRLALAVDSDPKVTELYRRYLTGCRLSVISISDLGQAAAAAQSLQPAVITLDASMQSAGSEENDPLSGWDLLKILKDDPATRTIPVVVCTLTDEAERALALGAAGYLMKPILEEDLVREIDRVL